MYNEVLSYINILDCQKRETCEDVAARLAKDGISAAAYHAGLADAQRDLILKNWTQDKTFVIVGKS
jgi:superfamily II DNA helicase RecQ